MKKKVLFIIPATQVGGTRTSLINLLKAMKSVEADIDVFAIKRHGKLLEQFEQTCNILPESRITESAFNSFGYHLKKFDFKRLFCKLSLTLKAKLSHTDVRKYALKAAAVDFDGKYDCVIGYQEGYAVIMAAAVKAPLKFAWVHRAYDGVTERIPHVELKNQLSGFDRVIFASKAIMHGYIKSDCVDEKRAVNIYNTFDTEAIIEKSKRDPIDMPKNVVKIVSVGRFTRVKRYDRIIGAAEQLKAEGLKFVWYIIGGGELYDAMVERAHRKHLKDVVCFTGMTDNPYRYIVAADVTFITSESEGHPMVANESLILGKPVITTHYHAAKEVVTDEVTGLICENSSDGVRRAAKRIIEDGELLSRLTENVRDFKYDNAAIVEQVEALINGKI